MKVLKEKQVGWNILQYLAFSGFTGREVEINNTRY